MNYINDNLEKLEEIAKNPNLNGGVWNSLRLFIKISDGLLRSKENFQTSSIYKKHSDEELIQELEGIREKFEKEFGFKLSSNNGKNPRFESLKNSHQSQKFKKRIFEFLRSYKGKFL